MAAFGMTAPRSPMMFADPNTMDAGASSAGPALVMPAKPAAPRGAFGRGFLSWFTPQRLQIIGAGLRQAGGVNGALDQELALQQQAQQQQIENDRQGAEDKWQAQQRQVQADALARQMGGYAAIRQRLSPEMQGMFDADPQGFMTALIARSMPGQWQGGSGFDHAYRINPDGSTDVGGRIPIRPNQYSMFGDGTDAPTFRPNPAGVAAPVPVRTPQEAQRLPPGTHYTTPDGQEFVR